jgi:hypothetical protein
MSNLLTAKSGSWVPAKNQWLFTLPDFMSASSRVDPSRSPPLKSGRESHHLPLRFPQWDCFDVYTVYYQVLNIEDRFSIIADSRSLVPGIASYHACEQWQRQAPA